jgi:predicted outer membrane lipoprotein
MEIGLVGLCPARHGLGIPLASTDTPSGGTLPFLDRIASPSCAFAVLNAQALRLAHLHRRRATEQQDRSWCHTSRLPRGRPQCVT